MASVKTQRRAFAPEQMERVRKSTAAQPTIERTKVFGVLEQGNDGALYLTKATVPTPVEVEKADDSVEESVVWTCPIVKADDDEQLVTGIVLQPEVVDAQKDVYDEGVVKAAAHDFLRNYNAGSVIGFMHKDMNRALELVESWIAPVDMKLGDSKIKKGTWLMTVHISEEGIWKSVKEGKIAGFSIGGLAKVQRLDGPKA